ncbi:MAG: hypothetical protein M3P34_07290 [Actinomycetota bacterium]|nr:hypothetical protein [Actinomycetota bacterium]
MALLASACGGGGSGAAGGGETRKVLVDYKHDEFSASFLAYFPTDVRVTQGTRWSSSSSGRVSPTP